MSPTVKTEIKPATGKLGILTPGMGAVATTFIAGVEAIRRGLAKPIGSLTQMGTIRLGKRTDNRSPLINEFVPLAKLDDIVFGGWDLFPAAEHDVVELGERNELMDQRRAPVRALAQPDRPHLGQRPDRLGEPAPDRFDAGHERGGDRAHSGRQDAELAGGRLDVIWAVGDMGAPSSGLVSRGCNPHTVIILLGRGPGSHGVGSWTGRICGRNPPLFQHPSKTTRLSRRPCVPVVMDGFRSPMTRAAENNAKGTQWKPRPNRHHRLLPALPPSVRSGSGARPTFSPPPATPPSPCAR